MKRLYLYDDAVARNFAPLSLTRPVSELRAGAELIRARWERVSGEAAYGFIGADHLDDFEEAHAPPSARADSILPAGSVIVNSRFVVSLDARIDDKSAAFTGDGEVCGVRLGSSTEIGPLLDGSISLADLVDSRGTPTEVRGRWLRDVWDLVGTLEHQLLEDIPLIGAELTGGAIERATIIGRHPVYCETGSGIEPFVVFDASKGPILVRRGATIASFSRIVGPCYIGEDTQVLGESVSGCSIGNVCKVRGEMSATIMIGHANKGHSGFVGNSYVGRWVNLGAGTTTSNLKNTYGTVTLWTPDGTRDTGEQFLGSLIGDHAKLGIGTLLTTGCVIGAGANVFGGHMTPKYVPPFAWGEGEPWGSTQFEKFCDIASRMMERRHIAFGERTRRQLAAAYQKNQAAS